MSTVNPTLPTTSFIGNDDFNWWLGTVKNNDDKDAKLGRVKVCILGYHKPEETPENLPWAMVMAPTDSAGVHGVGTAPASLKPGSFVVGFFLDYPDCQQPIVIGTLLSKIKSVEEKQSAAAKDYPGSYENSVRGFGTDTTDRGVSATAIAENTVDNSVKAAVSPASSANPSGTINKQTIADGKNGGDKTLAETISEAISEIIGTLSQTRKVPKGLSTKLSADIDSEEQVIPVSSTTKFPPHGIVRINGERVGYNSLSSKKFTLAKRGMDDTTPSRHKKGAAVTIITKGEDLGGSSDEGDLFGAFTDTLVDLKGIIDVQLEKIRNALWWLVNQIKSFLMETVTKILNAIGIAAISPIPMFSKMLTDVIMFILKEIVCILDVSLIEALFSGIEAAIMQVVNSVLSVVDQVQCIFDAIFQSIFSLIDIANDIFSLVNDISSIISSVGNVSEISNLSSLNITSALEFIFALLGIGCNRDTRDPFALTFTSCPVANLLSCEDGNPYGASFEGIKGRHKPEYSKIMGTFSETGSTVYMDDTPHSTKMVIEHGPSKSGVVIYDNGDMRITSAGKQTEFVVKDQEIIVKGNLVMNVDGNYHLKVGGDYHLEVGGKYNIAANQESKITYAGEHKTIMKNDGRIEATNGLALVASKLGLSSSGQTEMHTPNLTTWTTEQNHIALGSFNVICMFKNNFIGANNLKLIGLNDMRGRIGTRFDFGLGLANKLQIGADYETYMGAHGSNGFGIWSENKLAVDQELTVGVTSFTKAALSWETVAGAKFENMAGAAFNTAAGVKGDLDAGLHFGVAPLRIIT